MIHLCLIKEIIIDILLGNNQTSAEFYVAPGHKQNDLQIE